MISFVTPTQIKGLAFHCILWMQPIVCTTTNVAQTDCKENMLIILIIVIFQLLLHFIIAVLIFLSTNFGNLLAPRVSQNIFFCHHKLPCDAGKKFPSLRIVYNQPHMTTIASIQDSSNGSKHCTRTKNSISAIFYISLCETKIPVSVEEPKGIHEVFVLFSLLIMCIKETKDF